jgi:hypothetical protein
MKRMFLWGALILALGGCSEAQVGRWAFQQAIGQHVHCQVPAALDFPDTVVLDLGQDDTAAGRIGGVFAAAMLGGSLESKVGQAVKEAALPLRESAAAALQKQVVDAALFGKVDTDAGDVRLGWGISRWGLRKNEQGKIETVLDLEATLSVPGFGVIWRGTKSAADLGQAAKERATGLSLAVLAGGPQEFQGVLDVCLKDLGGQLLVQMANADPKRRIAIP